MGGYFLLLDITDRSFQGAGRPWELAKGQDNFLPVSDLIELKDVKDPYQLDLHLQINGKTVQKDVTGNMYYKIDDIIEFVSRFITLNDGDLILMGTPDGVGPMKPGDHIDGKLSQGENVLASLLFDVI